MGLLHLCGRKTFNAAQTGSHHAMTEAESAKQATTGDAKNASCATMIGARCIGAGACAWLSYTGWGVLVIFGAGVFNLFGLRTATERYSESLLVLALAPLYPSPGGAPLDDEDLACGGEAEWQGDWYARRRGAATVVLLDDSFLRQQDLHWPVPHGTYAHLLRRIAMLQPAAIFLDVVLSDRHSPDDQRAALVSTLENIQSGNGPPVFAAAPNPCAPFPTSPDIHWEDPQRTLKPGRGVLKDVLPVVRPVVIQWWGYGTAYPLVIEREQMRLASGQSDDDCLAARSGETEWPSPALGVYQAYFDRCLRARHPERTVTSEAFELPMLVRWGASVARPDALAPARGCVFVDPDTTAERIGWSAWLLARELARSVVRLGTEPKLPCPYIESLSAAAFFPDLSDGTLSPDYREMLRRRIEGRAVFVGASLFGADHTESPVNGQVAGVFEHAMAFDNLVQYGERYIRKQRDSFWLLDCSRWLEIATAMGALALLGAIRVGAEWQVGRGHDGAARPQLFFTVVLLWLAVCGAAVVFLAWVALRWHESPVNYLGIFAGASASNLGALDILRGKRAEWLGGTAANQTISKGDSR